MGNSKKKKEESNTVDEGMQNTFNCIPIVIYGEGDSKAEEIKAKLQRQGKT